MLRRANSCPARCGQVSDYLDTDGGATDVEDGDMTEYGDTETEPLMAAVSERNVAPVDESEDFVSPHPCLGTDEQDVTAGSPATIGCVERSSGGQFHSRVSYRNFKQLQQQVLC